MLEDITPLLLTCDEAPNIQRTLEALDWAHDVVVVDSGSSDGTLEVLKRQPSVRVFSRRFDTHSAQWSFGLSETGIETSWVLALDADHVLTPELTSELSMLVTDSEVDGFEADFDYCVFGRKLKSSLYPSRLVLVRRRAASFVQDGHTQRLLVKGQVSNLKGKILHDDRKPISRWISDQDRYARLEARHLTASKRKDLGFADRLRKSVVVSPFAVFFFCLLFKRGLLDGWPGWYYAFQRMTAEALLSVRLLDLRLRSNSHDSEINGA